MGDKKQMKNIVNAWNRVSLIAKIAIGIVIGAGLGILVPQATGIGLIGTMFVRALKAIAPILVFVLVISSIANAGKGNGKQFRMITFMYILSTMLAAVVAVSASFLFPVTMTLDIESYQSEVVPSGIVEVLQNILMNITAYSFNIAAIIFLNNIRIQQGFLTILSNFLFSDFLLLSFPFFRISSLSFSTFLF